MAELASFSRVDLRQALERLFDDEELRTLCFDLGTEYDYDGLRGEGKRAKARELVALAERQGHLAALEAAIRRRRPAFDTTFSYQRVKELQKSILDASQPDVRDAFVEFTHQVEAYLNEFNLLHEQLEEWKEAHNMLQDLQNSFAPCCSYIFTLARLEGSAQSVQRQQERILYEVEVEWRPCKRCLHKLQQLATSIQAIGEPYEPEPDSGPDWFLLPKRTAAEIDRALLDANVSALTEQLSAFGDVVAQSLYLADKALRDVVRQINHLPRPGSYAVRSE
jgi:DNA repair exonuclease SbcCD ATPase subunit